MLEATKPSVDFHSPPLSVGQEPVREILDMRRGKATLRLLSPTDCFKDRLAAFYHWNDRQSLDQAILVCRDAEVDLAEVERWSIAEGMKSRFRFFKKSRRKRTCDLIGGRFRRCRTAFAP